LAIVLAVPLFTAFDYSFGIFLLTCLLQRFSLDIDSVIIKTVITVYQQKTLYLFNKSTYHTDAIKGIKNK